MKIIICEYCKKEFSPKNRVYSQKYCSRSCAGKDNFNKGRFKVGYVPWNKGLIGYRKGYVMSKQTKLKIGEANKGENNAKWKGDNVGYIALHSWIQKWGDKIEKCQHCGKEKCRLEWANISGEYKRDKNDFIKLCVKCHKKMDRR